MRNLKEWRGHIDRFITSNIDPHNKVLDVGIGHSTTSIRNMVGENFTILDKSDRGQLYEYEPFIGQARFVCKNLLVPDDVDWVRNNLDIDTVVCAEVFEHTEDFFTAARNLASLITKGRLIITVPCDLGHHPGHHYGDYWRFMPSSLKCLFSKYEVRETSFKVPGSDMYYGIGAVVYV